MTLIDKKRLLSKLRSFFGKPTKKKENLRYLPSGECALVMEFGDEISKEINGKIRQAMKKIQEHPIQGLQELIPTYRSITLLYSPLEISFSQLVKELEALELGGDDIVEEQVRLIEIPTLYGADYGPDPAMSQSMHSLAKKRSLRFTVKKTISSTCLASLRVLSILEAWIKELQRLDLLLHG